MNIIKNAFNAVKNFFIIWWKSVRTKEFFFGAWTAVIVICLVFGFVSCSSTVKVSDSASVGSVVSSAEVDNFGGEK